MSPLVFVVFGVLWLIVLLFVWALCVIAARSDAYMDAQQRERA